MLDCRKALEQADGDFEKAARLPAREGPGHGGQDGRPRGLEGVVELYSHGNGRVGVMVEVNCETDFVAAPSASATFAHELALQIAATAPATSAKQDIPAEVSNAKPESPLPRAREEGKPERSYPQHRRRQLKKFKDETVLLRQTYIRDENLTVQRSAQPDGRRHR